MHSSLPSLNEGLQRLSAVNQELDRKSIFAVAEVAPQAQEALWMGCELCAQSRVREFALEEGVLLCLPRRQTQLRWDAHASLTDPPAMAIAIPVGRYHESGFRPRTAVFCQRPNR